MLFTFEFVYQIFPNIVGEMNKSISIHAIMDDSREQKASSLFVPIVGENFNGHAFLKNAIENGAVGSFWQKDEPIPEDLPTSFVLFMVDNTVEALQDLAYHYREKVNPIVIGITGSNGKTTTKDIVHAILKTKAKTHATVGNFNNLIGLPLTILQMEDTTKFLVLEMGMDRFFEIEKLTEIAQPDYAVITNIGESHIEFLGSREGITSAKLEILQGLKNEGLYVFDGDEPLLKNRYIKHKYISCGFTADSKYEIEEVQIDNQGTTFSVNGESYKTSLIGKHHAKNASYAIAIAKSLGLNMEMIQKGLNQIDTTAMRFEVLVGQNDVLLINDAYNASVVSMKGAILTVKDLYINKKKVLVLGDMYELGPESKMYHRQIAEVIDQRFEAVYTYGKDAIEIVNALQTNDKILKQHFTNKSSLYTALEKHFNKDTVILFKGSRGLKLEEVIDLCK